MALQFSQGNRINIATNIAITASAPTIKISSKVLFTFSISDLQIRPLVPEADSENEAHVIDDAAFGTSTELAVQKFQEQADLDPDGKVGMKTLTQLDNMLAFLEIPNPQPSPFDSD